MLSKNKISHIRSLHQKKFREEEGLFIAEGRKVVSELLASDFIVHTLVGTPDGLDAVSIRDAGRVGEIIESNVRELERISALTTPQEVLAVAEMPAQEFRPEYVQGKITLMLDDIRDPGNLGTLLRIAHWFGAGQIICSLNSVDAFNPKVVQSAMGSLFHVPVYSMGLEGIISQIKMAYGLPVYAALLGGTNAFASPLSPEGVYLFGNESTGLRTSLVALADHRIEIPSFELQAGNKPESLNVAVSAALLLAEIRKS